MGAFVDIYMRIAKSDNFCQVEAFLAESGIAHGIMLNAVAVGLRRRLASEGAICFVRRDGRLRLRALLAPRWDCSSSERIEYWLVSAIWATNPHARIHSVQLRKNGCYIEAEIDVT